MFGNIIESTGNLLGRVVSSIVNDNKGFIQQGHLTARPVQQWATAPRQVTSPNFQPLIPQQTVQQVQNFAQSIPQQIAATPMTSFIPFVGNPITKAYQMTNTPNPLGNIGDLTNQFGQFTAGAVLPSQQQEYNKLDLGQKLAASTSALGAFIPQTGGAAQLAPSLTRALAGLGIGAGLNYAGQEPGQRSLTKAFTDPYTLAQGAIMGLTGAEGEGDIMKAQAEKTPLPKYAGSINLNRLNIPTEAKQNLTQLVNDIKPDLQQIKGAPVSHAEVLDAVNQAKLLNRVIPREQTVAMQAAVTKLRMATAAGAEGIGMSKDFINNFKIAQSYATHAGRILNAYNIEADPSLAIAPQVKQQLLSQLLKLGKKTSDITKAAEGVDFNDPRQVTAFYRQFVKPQLADILREYRYINLLSSPATLAKIGYSHIMQGAILNPLTKTVAGGFDFIASAIPGFKRQHYVSEVPAYLRGAFANLGTALTGAFDTILGRKWGMIPNVQNLPTGSKISTYGRMITTNLHSAIYNFFQDFIGAGEREALATKLALQGKKMSPAMIDQLSHQAGAYGTFRTPLDLSNKSDQGYFLSAIDHLSKGIGKISNDFQIGNKTVPNPINFLIPFFKIATDLFKKGIEYSPLGFGTIPGAADKTTQLAKATIGSMVTLGTAYIAHLGDGTWAPPVNKKDRQAFYASGRQPYSLKVGNHWVSLLKFGQLAPAIALGLAAKYYFENAPKANVDSVYIKIAKTLTGPLQRFSDESYMRGIGDGIKAFEGLVQGDDYYWKQFIANTGGQLIPLSSLVQWASNVIDPRIRQPQNLTQTFLSRIPVASLSVPALQQNGQDVLRQNYLRNSFSLVEMQQNEPSANLLFQARQQQTQTRATLKDMKNNPEKYATQTTTQQGKFGDIGKFFNERFSQPKPSLTDLYKVELPQFTGNKEVDQKLVADHTSQIDSNIKNILSVIKATKDPQQKQQFYGQIQALVDQEKQIKDQFKYSQDLETVRSPLVPLTLSGYDVLDKRLRTSKVSEISKRGQLIVKLYNKGQLPSDEAQQLLSDLGQFAQFVHPPKAKKLRIRIPRLSTRAPSIRMPRGVSLRVGGVKPLPKIKQAKIPKVANPRNITQPQVIY